MCGRLELLCFGRIWLQKRESKKSVEEHEKEEKKNQTN